jgi:uncharacterized protein
MDDTYAPRPAGLAVGGAATLFARTMGYVAATTGLFALGACLGRGFPALVAFGAYLVSFAALIAMHFAVRRSRPATVALLAAFGLLMGVAVAPTLVHYASTDPQALWQAAAATALFVAAFGAAGYATRRDLTALARICFWALVFLDILNVFLFFLRIFRGR